MNRQKRKYIREILRQMVHVNYFSAVRVRTNGWQRYWTTSCPVLHVKVNTIDFSEIAERVRERNAALARSSSVQQPVVRKMSDIVPTAEDLVQNAPAIEGSDCGFYLEP